MERARCGGRVWWQNTNPSMRRPLIFIATEDPDFEKVARGAVVKTNHRISTAGDIRQACRALIAGSSEIALAIIDIDLDQGLSLLRILKGWEPGFPILAVASASLTSLHAELFAGPALCCLDKATASTELEQKIRELCAGGATAGAPCLNLSRILPQKESGETGRPLLWKPLIS